MNCKQGDVAIIVACHVRENVGKVVTCLRLAPGYYTTHRGIVHMPYAWEIDQAVKTVVGVDSAFIDDACLKPIRPDELGLTEENVRELYQPSPIKETST